MESVRVYGYYSWVVKYFMMNKRASGSYAQGWEGGGGGGGELPYEKVGDACREFLFWPLRGTKTGSVRDRKSVFRNTGLILSRNFPSLAPEPLSGTVSTPKCYCLMFSTLSGTRTQDFDP